MNFLLTLLILIVILGLIVSVHEFGHFLAAKKAKVHVSEFAIGMGPKIFSFRRKNDETLYSIRIFPLGGFNALASTNEDNPNLKKEQILENKSPLQKFLVLLMGIIFNFALAVILLFINGLLYGVPETKPYVGSVIPDTPAYISGLKDNDLILSINGEPVSNMDEVMIIIKAEKLKEKYVFVVQNGTETERTVEIVPTIETKDDEELRTFGFSSSTTRNKGFINALKYSVTGVASMTDSLFNTLGKLFTGKLSVGNLSGPIGVFTVIDSFVDDEQGKGVGSVLETLIYLTAYLSLNVAIINLIPIPIFDGGRILLVIIETIKRKKVNPKVEYYLNASGVILLILLMAFVTLNDILKLF